MPRTLKTVQPYFDDVWHGRKKIEVRKNDRDFQVGQQWILKEYDPESNTYSGREMGIKITYILDSPEYCKDGFVIFSFVNYPVDWQK